MTDDIRTLLRDWGQWMREDQAMPRGIGYPEQAIGADQMAPPPARSQGERQEADRIAHIAKRTGTYRTNPEGRRERVRPMIPQTQPSESRSRRPRSPEYEPESLEVRLCHNAIQTLPVPERNAVFLRYVENRGLRDAADHQGISQAEYRERLTRAEGHVRGAIVTAA